MRLTGRRRFRTIRKWFREYLVLEVEVEGVISENWGSFVECRRGTWWITASTEHLTEHERQEIA